MADPLASMMLAGAFQQDSPQAGQMPIQTGYVANGPAAVPVLNQAQANYQGAVDRSFRASDTANDYNKLLLDEAMKTQALTQSNRDIAMGQNDITKSMLDNGSLKTAAQTGVNADIADKLNKADASDKERYNRQAQGWLQLKAINDSGPMTPGKRKLIEDTAKEYGLSNKLPDIDDSKFGATIEGGARAATQVQQHLQAIELERVKGSEAQKTAAVSGQYSLAGATRSAEATEFASQQSMGAQEARAYRAINDGNAGPGDLQIIRNATTRAIGAAAYQNRGLMSLDIMINDLYNDLSKTKDPTEQAVIQKQIKTTEAAYEKQRQRAMGLTDQETGSTPPTAAAPQVAPSAVQAGKPIHGKYKGVPGTYDPSTNQFTPD